MTGSTTSGIPGLRLKNRATSRTMAAENNIPVFAAAGVKCAAMASNCARTIVGGHGSSREILPGFWAVRHVIGGGAMHFQAAERLQISLNARLSAAVGAGDGQGDGYGEAGRIGPE